MENSWNLDKVKKEYSAFQSKYNLPAFQQINEDFQVEKVADSETDFVLREIRIAMTEKFLTYLRFTESIINPSNAPMFIFAVVKTFGTKEKEKLAELYNKLAKIDMDLIEMDLQYSEIKEAETIKRYYSLWQDIKKDFIGIVEVIKNNWDNKSEKEKGNYLG